MTKIIQNFYKNGGLVVAPTISRKYPKKRRNYLGEGGTPKVIDTKEEANKAKVSYTSTTPSGKPQVLDARGYAFPRSEVKTDTIAKPKPRLFGGSTGQAAYADGGEIHGEGTAKSDSIDMMMDKKGFIVPAEHAQAAQVLRDKYLTPVKVSNGEHYFTAEEVKKLRANGIDLNKLAPNAKPENKLKYAKMSPALAKYKKK